ncbi:MAG TPA: hypothetical protein VIL86_21045 [Tepidisphaeraceae bacterium]|jgi:hypothetical protein
MSTTLHTCILGLLLLACPACQAPRAKTSHPTPAPAATQANRVDPSQVVRDDPCATRLHDISGLLLMYYAYNKQLPKQLTDLRPLADADTPPTPLRLECPVSKMAYVYVPAGLQAEGRSKRIIVHDPAPSHDGKRWCIFLTPPTAHGGGGAAPSLEVLAIPEPLFQAYHTSP